MFCWLNHVDCAFPSLRSLWAIHGMPYGIVAGSHVALVHNSLDETTWGDPHGFGMISPVTQWSHDALWTRWTHDVPVLGEVLMNYGNHWNVAKSHLAWRIDKMRGWDGMVFFIISMEHPYFFARFSWYPMICLIILQYPYLRDSKGSTNIHEPLRCLWGVCELWTGDGVVFHDINISIYIYISISKGLSLREAWTYQ